MQVPWEGCGTSVAGLGFNKAMLVAGADFEVKVRQGYFLVPEDGQYFEAPGYYYIVRTDTEPNVVLGQCKSRFNPIQNKDAFSFVRTLEREDTCSVDIIGVLGSGEKVWLLAKIHGKKYEIVPGDEISLYLWVVNTHDESQRMMIGLIPYRVFCTNMFSSLLRNFDIIKFKHTMNYEQKLVLVKNHLLSQLKRIEGLVEDLRFLATVHPKGDQLGKYYNKLIGVDDESSTKKQNIVKRLLELYVMGRGNLHPGVVGTWYAAYNAASEYFNFEAGHRVDSRLQSLWFGVNNIKNKRAFELALEMANE